MKIGSIDIIKAYYGTKELTNRNAFIGDVPVIDSDGNIVPIIPIGYIFLLVLTTIPGNQFYDKEVSSVLLRSHAFSRLKSDRIAIYPNELLNFNIQDVYNFFDSIDEYGVAHINNMYNNPCYTRESILNPKIYNWVIDFCQWHNIRVDRLISNPKISNLKSLIVNTMANAFNSHLDSYDENGNLIFDFNNGNMHFYDVIDDCLNDFSKYSEEIVYMYHHLRQVLPVRAIFVLETNDFMFHTPYGAIFPKLTIGFITDKYTIFTMLQNKENK